MPPAVVLDEVDGVPVVWGTVEGPLAASLIFRVGRSDETLVSSGITHLVEHLALYREGLTGAASHFNGQVDDITATFYLHGEPDEVSGFLSRVTTNLGSLPMERLVAEREILRSEAANRSLGGGYASLLRWRYGPQTYGLGAYVEFGLHRLEAPEVEAWAARMFTRENAVLMLSGPPPAGLRLNLPGGGQRLAPVAPSSALPEVPAWYQEGDPGAALLSSVPRSTTANVMRYVVEQRLRSRLRYDLGASYSPGVVYEPRDAHEAHLYIGADAVPEHADAVRREVGEVLKELTVDDVVAADLDVWSRGWSQSMVEPGARRGWVYTQAMDVLLQRPRLDFDAWNQEIRDLQPEDVVRVARSAHATSLLRMGGDFEGRLNDRAEAPLWSPPGETVGRTFEEVRETEKSATGHLVVGPKATSVRMDRARRVEVPHDEVAAVLEWPDGKVTVIGTNAFSIQVDPRHWLDGTQAVEELRSRIPAALFVLMPPRDVPPVNVFTKPTEYWWRAMFYAVVTALLLLGTIGALSNGQALVPGVLGCLAALLGAHSWRRYRQLMRVRGFG